MRAYARPSRDDAWRFTCDPSRVSQAIRRSDLRSLDSAVQSRVGDGFLAVRSDGSESQAQLDGVARLPEHEVRGECEGLEVRCG